MQHAKFHCCNWKIVLSSLFLWQMSLGLHGARQRRKDPLEHVSIHVWISSCSIVSLILCYIFESVFGAHLIPVPGENFQVVCVLVLFSLHYSKLLCSFCVTNEFSGVCVKLGWKIKWKKSKQKQNIFFLKSPVGQNFNLSTQTSEKIIFNKIISQILTYWQHKKKSFW